jgi:GNAT superfamily N-acetyltransferase
MTSLRPARPEDSAALTQLVLRSKGHWGYDEDFLRRAEPAIAVTPERIAAWRVVVAERDGLPLGVSALSLDGEPPELELLFVDAPAIGTGVGRLLLRDALDAARAAAHDSLVVESDPEAEAFYLSQGAVRIGERESSMGRMLPLLRFTP